jgi:hypothetical protein
MTAFRLFSLPAHGALEMLVGLALMFAPFVLGFGDTAMLLSVVLGALLTGVALGAADAAHISAHYAADVVAVFVLFGAGILLALGGQRDPALLLVLAACAQLMLNLTTRYSAAR